MLKVKSLFLYPVKSFAGSAVSSFRVGPRGPQWDRQWMVVDEKGQFLTQRQMPKMSQISAQVIEDARVELNAPGLEFMDFGVEEGSDNEILNVKIWDHDLVAQEVDPEVSEWVSEFLGKKTRLVRLKDDAVVNVKEKYGEGRTTFTDGFPFLLLSTESMDLLNSKLGKALSVNRFRPNVLVSGGSPHEEDSWNTIQMGPVNLRGAKLCARCKVVTVQPLTGEFGDEPLKTLAEYRKTDKGIVFGKNFIHESEGEIRVGMPIEVLA